MSSPSNQEIEQIRSRADEVLQRARSDSSYMEQLRSNPAGTLRSAGIPDPAVAELLREDGVEAAEVSGYMGCYVTCTFTGCYITSISL